MDIHNEFTEWAAARGVKLNGISMHRFPGRGVGIMAEKEFKIGDKLLTIPNSALRTVQTVPKSISEHIGPITVQGLLAAELSLDTSKVRAPWRAILPTKDDFAESMPLMWHSSLQSLLPPQSLLLLKNQKKKISQDWTPVSAAFPTLSYDLYVHNWLIVSTRTFYYTSPKIKTKKPIKYDDCIALSPFADCFNHVDVGCEVTFSPSGYEISADRVIKKREEIRISYGNHNNDFLLTEYGFILAENRWDEICLDELILPLFSEEQKQELKEAGFLGNFNLDKERVCYRTKVALRLLCLPVNTWQRLVTNGLGDDDECQVTVDTILLKALKLGLDNVNEKLEKLKTLDYGLDSQRETLGRRWRQIRLLITAAITRIEA